MKSKMMLVLALFVTSSAAKAAVVVDMLYVGPETKAGFALEKDHNGEFYFLLQINGNPNEARYLFSPGTPLNDVSVITDSKGNATAILSIYKGVDAPRQGAEDVAISDPISDKTYQRSNMFEELRSLANSGLLVDADGKTYGAESIKSVQFVYQVRRKSPVFETELETVTTNLKGFRSGTVRQLAGETIPPSYTITVISAAEVRGIQIDNLDQIRFLQLRKVAQEELPKRLSWLGFTPSETSKLVALLLDAKNSKLPAAEIIEQFEASNKGESVLSDRVRQIRTEQGRATSEGVHRFQEDLKK